MAQVQGNLVAAAPAATDVDLARRAAARDAGAFRTIMQTHNRKLYRIARSIVRDDSEAEDILQEAYVRAFAHLEQFRGDFELGDLAFPHRDKRGARAVAQSARGRQ